MEKRVKDCFEILPREYRDAWYLRTNPGYYDEYQWEELMLAMQTEHTKQQLIQKFINKYGAHFKINNKVYFYSMTDAQAFRKALEGWGTKMIHPKLVSEFTCIMYIVEVDE